jgi:branched-chain amino acid transport system permease protein
MEQNNKKFNINIVFIIAAIVVFILLPNFVSGYYIRIFTAIFMYATIAQCINLMSGYMGYLPFGHVMFFGIGAYITAILMGRGLPFILAMPLAALSAIVVSIILGFPVLRLRGHYFAIATIGMNGAIMSVAQNATEITGGAMGTTYPIILLPPGQVYNYFYLAFFGLMVITALIMYFIVNSKFGYGIRSIKANEEAANSMGINTTYTKVSAWAISALFTSIAGGLYGYWMSFISPDEVFDLMFVTNSIIMMLIGGAGTILGPIAGAFIIESVSEFAWSGFMEYHLAVLGIATIMIVFFVPGGVIGTITNRIKNRRIALNKKAEVTNG